MPWNSNARNVGESFLKFIIQKSNNKIRWKWSDMEAEYNTYKIEHSTDISFGQVLYCLSPLCYNPPYFLRVLGSNWIVVFKRTQLDKYLGHYSKPKRFSLKNSSPSSSNGGSKSSQTLPKQKDRKKRKPGLGIQHDRTSRKNVKDEKNKNTHNEPTFRGEKNSQGKISLVSDTKIDNQNTGEATAKSKNRAVKGQLNGNPKETDHLCLGMPLKNIQSNVTTNKTTCNAITDNSEMLDVTDGTKGSAQGQKIPEIIKDSPRRGSRKVRIDKQYQRSTIPGVLPPSLPCLQDKDSGGNYQLPEYKVDKSFQYKKHINKLKKSLNSKLYAEKFHTLLYIEELQYMKDIKFYATESTLRLNRNLLYLEVPGLAEKRPSLLRGDRVYVIRLDADGNLYGDRYEGYVHIVRDKDVGLGFSKKLLGVFQSKMQFSVTFTFNRMPLQLMHRAVDWIRNILNFDEMLFPTEFPQFKQPDRQLIMFNSKIQKNEKQRTAVHHIVLGITPPIYIIFGPPGTGKTVTMVESILQTLRKCRSRNILVCALSNNACDLLAEKLHEHVDRREMLRLYATSRSWNDVPTKIQDYVDTNHSIGGFMMPSSYDIKKRRIVICTFVTAGRLASKSSLSNHFTNIFIDESGQAFEPECLIAVAGNLAVGGKIVLAGDPKQLGPIVRSPICKTHGLQISLLERLMSTNVLYKKDSETGEYNPQCVTKLVKNYRSHESILKIPNKKFYDNELEVNADQMIRTKLCGWEELPNKDFPIIFHGVQGNQTKEKSSPSYFNPEEVKVVGDYVKKLLDIRGMRKMKPCDIGIVTPYRKQVEKIRNKIKNPNIDVGSVEVFQGQERLVIIISTVRSSKEGLTDDAIFHLGFLCDPKRFNVSLTRPKALLIIVGNPRLLCLDKYWKSLLKYCLKNKAYRGVKFTSDDFEGANNMKEIEDLFDNLEITEDNVDEERHVTDQSSPYWRNEH
ncbi:putative helicase mov-10-B.1 [Styela clava]